MTPHVWFTRPIYISTISLVYILCEIQAQFTVLSAGGDFKFNNFPKYYHNTAWMNENFLCMSEEQIWCVWTIAISKLKVVKQVIMNGAFLAHLNRRLKWAFLMKICPLSVVVIVVVFVFIVVNFSHFDLLLQNQWASFNQTWHKSSLCEGDSSLFKWRATPFSKWR